jgi:hypothetical protein
MKITISGWSTKSVFPTFGRFLVVAQITGLPVLVMS